MISVTVKLIVIFFLFVQVGFAQNCDSLINELRNENDRLRAMIVDEPESEQWASDKIWYHNFAAGVGQGGVVGFPFMFSPSALVNYVIYKPKRFAINAFLGAPFDDLKHPFISLAALYPVLNKPLSFKRKSK